jgi:hypothetical protein
MYPKKIIATKQPREPITEKTRSTGLGGRIQSIVDKPTKIPANDGINVIQTIAFGVRDPGVRTGPISPHNINNTTPTITVHGNCKIPNINGT